jgi:hypothetical protein
MFVTSDILDIPNAVRGHNPSWRENLICGVDIQGSVRGGPPAEADFLVRAAGLCGLLPEMKWAGYGRRGDPRTYRLQPASMLKLATGKLRGPANASTVLLHGERAAVGSHRDAVMFGGDSSSARSPHAPQQPEHPFNIDFCFPLNKTPLNSAAALLRLSVDVLDAEYGYYFVRDDYVFPTGYTSGIVYGPEFIGDARQNLREVATWRDYVYSKSIWTDAWPKLRDLYEVNLLSERHTGSKIDSIGFLLDWILAAPGRGSLEDLPRGRVLWTLSDAEMFNIRPLLFEAGLLLTCLDRVYRDLTPGLRGPNAANLP